MTIARVGRASTAHEARERTTRYWRALADGEGMAAAAAAGGNFAGTTRSSDNPFGARLTGNGEAAGAGTEVKRRAAAAPAFVGAGTWTLRSVHSVVAAASRDVSVKIPERWGGGSGESEPAAERLSVMAFKMIAGAPLTPRSVAKRERIQVRCGVESGSRRGPCRRGLE